MMKIKDFTGSRMDFSYIVQLSTGFLILGILLDDGLGLGS